MKKWKNWNIPTTWYDIKVSKILDPGFDRTKSNIDSLAVLLGDWVLDELFFDDFNELDKELKFMTTLDDIKHTGRLEWYINDKLYKIPEDCRIRMREYVDIEVLYAAELEKLEEGVKDKLMLLELYLIIVGVLLRECDSEGNPIKYETKELQSRIELFKNELTIGEVYEIADFFLSGNNELKRAMETYLKTKNSTTKMD